MHHNARTHQIKSELGEIVTVNGIYKFAKHNGLNGPMLSLLINGHVNKYRGYTLHKNMHQVKQQEITIEQALFNNFLNT